MKEEKFAVLLATYNGEKYIGELLDSLCQQTFQDWILYVHDDGSSDSTCSIIKEYVDKLNIVFLGEEQKHLGAKDSFFYLLQHVDADYYFFCDQDDVWLPSKMENCLNKAKEAEKLFPDKPIISHCGLKVVDANLQIIDESFHRMQRIYPEILNSFDGVCVRNYIPGCSMCFNKLAKEVSFPVNPYSTMHDHWIVLNVFAKGGHVIYIPQSLILYRQHQNNVVGASFSQKNIFFFVLLKAKRIVKVINGNISNFRQINAVQHISLQKYIKLKISFLIKLWRYHI